MTIERPYKRTYRPFEQSPAPLDDTPEYILHPKYAKSPQNYQRALTIIQKDFVQLLDYIEPASNNLGCYSFRTHELLMRICIEIEANFRAILKENGFEKKHYSRSDYKKLQQSHFLSEYQVKLPTWHGEEKTWRPFSEWVNSNADEQTLSWYTAYNDAKHDRQEQFYTANFGTVIEAMCGLIVVLTAQFAGQDFSPVTFIVSSTSDSDGYKSALGGYFLIKTKDKWETNQLYNFDWLELQSEDNPFQNYPFE